MNEICVTGLGYTGLPTALMLAAHGKQVVGVDINRELVKKLNNGVLTFQEDGLDILFRQALAGGIRFETDCPAAKIYIVAVPTPINRDTKKIDTSYVTAAVNTILNVCEKNVIIIIESTISPGTIDRFIRPSVERRGLTAGKDVYLAHAPERIIPGNMIKELSVNSRVIGADSIETGEYIRGIYSSFCKGDIILTDIKTAEMTKIVENTYRDVNIAFANELAKICRHDNLNVYEIIRIANMHPRVNILQPGPGVGGHCISVDPWFLVGDYPGLSQLIHEARKINDSMPEFVLKRVNDILNGNGIRDSGKIGFYGITYKEDVDDVRESPTMQIYEMMRLHLGGGALFYDPMIKANILNGQVSDFNVFLEKCDLVVIMVGHRHIIENMDLLKDKLVLDTKNICMLQGCYYL